MVDRQIHKSQEQLSSATLDQHRALVSLIEELEAVDWYMQRIDAADNDELKRILEHNRQEELEHAAMLLEWLRRKDDILAKELKDNLFTDKAIAQ
jgi:hypothetical protein